MSASTASRVPERGVRQALVTTVLGSVPASGRLSLAVFRHGSRIGTHTVRFTTAGDALVVRIDVALRVGFCPLILSNYAMQAIERWQNQRFVGMNASGNDDGTSFQSSAVAAGDYVAITATGIAPYTTPPGALPLTRWNRHAMRARFSIRRPD